MASATPVPRKLWEHPNPQSTPMYKFLQATNKKHSISPPLKTFSDLHAYSLAPGTKSQFWSDVFTSAEYHYSGTIRQVVDESKPISAVPKWFEGVELNFAENMLLPAPNGSKARGSKRDGDVAITGIREGGKEVRDVTWGELRRRSGRLAAAMKHAGVVKGDRVVVVGANSVETVCIMIAATWLGAIFSSSSTDMGVKGILQRTVQVTPKLLFFDDKAVYNGREVDLREKIAETVAGLKDIKEFLGVVVIPRFPERGAQNVKGLEKATSWEEFHARAEKEPVPKFVRIGFNEPFLICYSSGTTGIPKAIVHSVGGVLVNYYKEGVLHEGNTDKDVTLQYTTVGWIMYVANVGILLFGGRSVMYDGSPFQPDAKTLIRVVEQQKVTKLGISPRWMLELAKNGIVPKNEVDLSSLRIVTCTGMVLSDQLFEWFYDVGFPKHIHLANISGGTDIAGCFGLMNPLTPVYVGGTQGPSLGIHVAIYDALLPNGPGKEVPVGTPGELVAAASFPNIPCSFWNDQTPVATPGSKYHAAYFGRFDNVWAHGDFCCVHPVTGNVYFLGRADGVLNPSGVRFGSAEIYSVIERYFVDRVADSLCVGQRRPQDDDESVMLFLLMKPGNKFDKKLVNEVKEAIRKDLSKRHVPKYIFETPEIPTTVNLKKVELPVKQIVSGQEIKASGTLLNPKSLDFYYQFAKVEDLIGPKEKL